jgi:protein gp37
LTPSPRRTSPGTTGPTPVTGCDEVSPGCAHCYAKTFAERWRGIPGHPYEQGFDLKLWPERLEIPLRWRKPRMIFVNSMSDLFHEDVPRSFIRQVFSTMGLSPHHTFQVLTKRPERMREEINDFGLWSWARRSATNDDPLPNVWLGTSIENRRFVHRADELREIPAEVRFISAEPLLGPLVWDAGDGLGRQTSTGYVWADYTGPQLDLTAIDWLIVGGESGPHHRPMRPEWVRDLRDVAQQAGTAFFFKQVGGTRPKSGGRELDGRTWDEMPQTHEGASPRIREEQEGKAALEEGERVRMAGPVGSGGSGMGAGPGDGESEA